MPRYNRRFHRQPVMRPSWQRCGQQENQSWPRRRRRLFRVLFDPPSPPLPTPIPSVQANARARDATTNVFPSNYCVYTWDLPGNLPLFRDNSRLPRCDSQFSSRSNRRFSTGSKLNGNHARISSRIHRRVTKRRCDARPSHAQEAHRPILSRVEFASFRNIPSRLRNFFLPIYLPLLPSPRAFEIFAEFRRDRFETPTKVV